MPEDSKETVQPAEAQVHKGIKGWIDKWWQGRQENQRLRRETEKEEFFTKTDLEQIFVFAARRHKEAGGYNGPIRNEAGQTANLTVKVMPYFVAVGLPNPLWPGPFGSLELDYTDEAGLQKTLNFEIPAPDGDEDEELQVKAKETGSWISARQDRMVIGGMAAEGDVKVALTTTEAIKEWRKWIPDVDRFYRLKYDQPSPKPQSPQS